MSHILLVEDNAIIMDTNKEYLLMHGYSVHTATTLREGEAALKKYQFDLIILDIMLPDGSGVDFCAKIRENIDIPVLFLTCLEDEEMLLSGFTAGGDEYMTKPYSLAALTARAEALLRRVRIERSNEKSFRIGPLLIDCGNRKAYIDGEDTLLTHKEFEILLLLARDIGKGYTAEEIYNRIWGNESFDSRTVIVHISCLRKKLRLDDESPLSIMTEKRKYYSLQRE